MIIEVVPLGKTWECGGNVYRVTDSRLLSYIADGENPCICSHYLIDDLNAYESDSADEQAEVGDVAQIPQTVRVR